MRNLFLQTNWPQDEPIQSVRWSHSGHERRQIAMYRHTNSHILPITLKCSERQFWLVEKWTWIRIPPLYPAAFTRWCSLSEKLFSCFISFESHPIYFQCTTFALPLSSITQIRLNMGGPPAPSPLRTVHAYSLIARVHNFLSSPIRVELYLPTLLGVFSCCKLISFLHLCRNIVSNFSHKS